MRLNNRNCLVTRVQKQLYIWKPSRSSRKVGVSEGTNSREDPADEQHEPRSERESLQQFLGARIDEQEAFPETRGHLCLCIAAELRLGSRSKERDPPAGMLHEPRSAPAPAGQLCQRGPCKGADHHSSLPLHHQKFGLTDVFWEGLNCPGVGDSHSSRGHWPSAPNLTPRAKRKEIRPW